MFLGTQLLTLRRKSSSTWTFQQQSPNLVQRWSLHRTGQGPAWKQAHNRMLSKDLGSQDEDYFAPTPVFNDRQFEWIYRVSKSIVQQLFDICSRTNPFFTAQRDVCGRFNIGPLVKVLMALKLIGFGCSASAFQDYFQMSITTACLCLLKFCRIISIDESLQSIFARVMTHADARRVSVIHEKQHGIARVFWKNCPVAWQGSQTGKAGKPTIVLEAFADHNLWFWHHSFGWPGSLNDINIWNQSCLLKAFLDGSFAANVDFEYIIGDKVFRCLWLAVNGIYPELSRFFKKIEEPLNRKAIVFAKWQEATPKDTERAFGVLQRKFQVLVRKIELWYVGDIGALVNTAIILHNMMVRNAGLTMTRPNVSHSMLLQIWMQTTNCRNNKIATMNKSNEMLIVGWRRLIYTPPLWNDLHWKRRAHESTEGSAWFASI